MLSFNEVNGAKHISSELSDAASAMPMAIPSMPEVKTLSNSSLCDARDTIPGATGYELWRGNSPSGVFTSMHSSHTVYHTAQGYFAAYHANARPDPAPYRNTQTCYAHANLIPADYQDPADHANASADCPEHLAP